MPLIISFFLALHAYLPGGSPTARKGRFPSGYRQKRHAKGRMQSVSNKHTHAHIHTVAHCTDSYECERLRKRKLTGNRQRGRQKRKDEPTPACKRRLGARSFSRGWRLHTPRNCSKVESRLRTKKRRYLSEKMKRKALQNGQLTSHRIEDRRHLAGRDWNYNASNVNERRKRKEGSNGATAQNNRKDR